MSSLPPITPLVRSHRAYAGAYRVIADHFAGHRLRIDAAHLITRARAVPVLYEWWCALEVIRILRKLLHVVGGGQLGRRLETEQGKYVVDFAPNQSVEFVDESGRRVRYRYLPAYLPPDVNHHYGLLGQGSVRTPDMAIEIFPADAGTVPELIIILDAKYTSAPHTAKLDNLKLKYDRIGEFRTGRVLGRQVWAMVPTRPPRSAGSRDWKTACTVDNIGVFAEHFPIESSAAGVVHAAPLTGPGQSTSEMLLRHLLSRCDLKIRMLTP